MTAPAVASAEVVPASVLAGCYDASQDVPCPGCDRMRHRDRPRCCSACGTGQHSTPCEVRHFQRQAGPR